MPTGVYDRKKVRKQVEEKVKQYTQEDKLREQIKHYQSELSKQESKIRSLEQELLELYRQR